MRNKSRTVSYYEKIAFRAEAAVLQLSIFALNPITVRSILTHKHPHYSREGTKCQENKLNVSISYINLNTFY